MKIIYHYHILILVDWLHAFPRVLIIDRTYKKTKMPLLEIVSVTFSVACICIQISSDISTSVIINDRACEDGNSWR